METKQPYKTGNPALNAKTFEQFQQEQLQSSGGTGFGAKVQQMTLQGTVNKAFLLVATTIFAASITWQYAFSATAGTAAIFPWVIGSSLIGFVIGLVIIFKNKTAPFLSIFYAAFQGLFLGGISAHYEASYPGIVVQTVGLTIAIFVSLLLAYSSKLIKPTENFKLGVFAATGGIALLYLVNMILSFGFHMPIPMIHESGPIGIGFSVVVVIIASMNLVLDFDFIENGVEFGAPKYMEWYSAFGLLVTLVWLYLEILRLLSKLRSK